MDVHRAPALIHSTQVGLKAAEDTLTAASSLLDKLQGEKQSWTAQAADHTADLATLPACAAAAAAFVVYAAAESEAVRAALARDFAAVDGLQLPDSFSVASFLSSESEMLGWKAGGLPGDSVRLASMRCAVLLQGSCRRGARTPDSMQLRGNGVWSGESVLT